MIYRSYAELIDAVQDRGEEVVVRGLRTKELRAVTLTVTSDLVPSRPGLASALGYMEACQFILGDFDLDALVRVAPRADHSLFTQQMAYGPRVQAEYTTYLESQLQWVVDELLEDESSRRAVIALPLPSERLQRRPCTSTVQFLLRGGCLDTVVSMRSWDIWWGLPYDITMFNVVAQCVAQCVGVDVNWTTVFAGSAHLYEPHWGLTPHPDRLRLETNLRMDDLRAWQHWAHERVYDTSWVTGPPLGFTHMRV